MPTYNPNKSPDKYPMAFAEALAKPLNGEPFVEYFTSYKVFPADTRKLRISQELSGFKAALRNFPGHPLSKTVDNVATRVEWRGQLAVIVSWKVFRPSTLLEGL